MENTELNPADFDINAWMDGASRVETVVELHSKGRLWADIKQIEARIETLRAMPPEDRSIIDDSSESLMEEWHRLVQEWADSAMRVRVQALNTPEIKKARKAAKDAKAPEDDHILWVVAAGTVEPKLTPEQLVTLRDRIGESELAMMYAAVMRLSNEAPKPTPPSWPGRSRGTRG